MDTLLPLLAALGGYLAGAVLVPVNTRFRGREAAYVLQRAHATVLFTVTDFLDTDYVAMLADQRASLTDLQHIVVMRGPSPEGTTSV